MDGDLAAVFEDAGVDSESLTVVLVAGGSRAEVLRLLGAEPEAGDPDAVSGDGDHSAYAAAEVAGGVVAYEQSGYGDPANDVLAALSALGGAAAVARSNVQAHERFGCARDGVLQFDADEFAFVEEDEKASVPDDLRALFDTAWIGDDDDPDSDEAAVSVALRMAALRTGVVVTTDDLARAQEAGWHRVRGLTYLS